MIRLLILGLAFWASFSFAAEPYSWSQFRGDTQMGHSDETVPLKWSETENLKWKVDVPGKAWSSPIIHGDHIFITTAVVGEAPAPTDSENKPDPKLAPLELWAMAMNLEDGMTLWKTQVFETVTGKMHKKNSHASPTPVYEDGKVYVHFGHHGTARLNAKSGAIEWRQDKFPYKPVHGGGSSPVIIEDKLIYSADAGEDPAIMALDKATGELAWRTPRDIEVQKPFSFCTPLVIQRDGQPIVISPGSGAVFAYDPQTGKEIWRCRWGQGYSVTPRPVLAHGRIYASSGFDRANLLAIETGGTGDVTDSHLKWKVEKLVPRESSPIVVGDEIYMNDDKGIATCMDAKTGAIHWQERISPDGGYSASPIYASGHLFFLNGEGVTTVIKPGKTFQKVGENSIGEFGLSSMAVIPGGFIHRTEKSLIRIGQ
ncbi:MAG: PQQ-binding-like beta-propeller repeat protein [Verrucomicrobiota bacterium]